MMASTNGAVSRSAFFDFNQFLFQLKSVSAAIVIVMQMKWNLFKASIDYLRLVLKRNYPWADVINKFSNSKTMLR